MEPKLAEAIHNERFVRIVCVGAGPSGLCFAYKLQRSFTNFSLTIYEKNEGVSGTWFENRYPGCACDIPAHNYTYSWEPKHDWSTTYAGPSEIRSYFEGFSTKYALGRYIRLRSQVVKAIWQETVGMWNLEIKDLCSGKSYHDNAHFLINASGYLNHWQFPSIPGIHEYNGKLIHSAAWPDDEDLTDKQVVLVGNGSSGVQILPAIQPVVAKITTFVRSPNWILGDIGSGQQQYTDNQIKNFQADPSALLVLRKYNETVTNSIFSVYIADSPLQKISVDIWTDYMRRALSSSSLEQTIIPDWAVGCRRLTPGVGYLESITKANVQVVQGDLVALTEDGCVAEDGTIYKADVVICATGFDTSFIPRFPIIGGNGKNLQDTWSTVPSSLLGISTTGFSNYFFFLGPYSPVNNGPTIPGIEAQADYILRLISRFQTENIHSISVNPESEADFTSHVAAWMKKSVWSDKCRSGSKNHTRSGRVPTLWPGSTLHYLEAMRQVRGDDWIVTYKGGRFDWLGNGISQAEFDPTCDLAYYVKDHDDGEHLSLARQRAKIIRSGTQPARPLHATYRPSTINLDRDSASGKLK